MKSDFSNLNDQEFIVMLRFQLLTKISDEWAEKWKPKKHGNVFDGISKLKSKNAFYEDLQQDIYTFIEDKLGKGILQDYFVSKDSILRFLNENYQFGFKKSTLDIFSIYCNYKNWTDFKTKNSTNIKPTQQPVVNVYTLVTTRSQFDRYRENDYVINLPAQQKSYKKLLFSLISLCILAFGAYYYWFKYLPFRTITDEEINTIKFEKTTQNNTHNPAKVTFAYDFSKLKLDSLKLAFPNQRGVQEQEYTTLRKPKGEYVFDFYKPGVHTVLLQHLNKTLKNDFVYVKSHGWACWYSISVPQWINTNLPYKDFYADGMLFLHPEKIKNPAHRHNYITQIAKADDFAIGIDSLNFQVKIKDSPDEYAISCYDLGIRLQSDLGKTLSVLFSREKCFDTSIKNAAPIHNAESQESQITLERLFYEWAEVRVLVKDKYINIWVDNELLTSAPYTDNFGQLRVIKFGSKGSAMYDDVRLSNSYTNHTIFFDNFNTVPPSSKKGY